MNYVAGSESADDVVREIVATGGAAVSVRADVSREDEVQDMFRSAAAAFGAVHILVNNAGLQRDAPTVNLTGQFLCAREAAREFQRRGMDPGVSVSAGKIICMSSVHEVIPWAGHANYAASKGGVSMLMKTLAQELAPWRIRVNSIAPGAIRTPINAAAWNTPEAYARLLQLIPYKRIGEPSDIAQAAVWLASDASDYVTGTTLFVDGGMTLYPGFEDNG